MRPADKVKRLVGAASFSAGPELDKALWAEIRKEHGRRSAADRTPGRRGRGRLGMHIRTTRASAAAILAAGMVIGVVIGSTISRPPTDSKSRANSSEATRASDNLQPDIDSMRQMAAAQDVKGLAAILSDGQFESRLVAANFLARMAPLPALETVSMHSAGELRADRRDGNLRLYSTGHSDWLELADSTITVHAASAQQRTTLVRLTHNPRPSNAGQIDLNRIRKDRADLEKRLANPSDLPGNVDQLRSRVDMYNRLLDLMDGAIYVSPAGGGLHAEDWVRQREVDLFPSDRGVRAEWHGVTVDANSITLQNQQLAPVRTDGPVAPPAGWRDRFDRVYSLADGEVLRWVRPPFIPERQYHLQELSENFKSRPSSPPQFLFLSFRWDGARHNSGRDMRECTLESFLQDLGRERGLRKYELGGPAELLQLRLGGDWIVRTESTFEQRLDALEKVLERELERRIRSTRKSVEREVIVVRGRYERRPLEGHENTDPIYLFAEAAVDPIRPAGPEEQTNVAGIVDMVGQRFHRPVILDVQGLDEVSVRVQPCLSYLIPIGPTGRPERTGPSLMQNDRNLDPVLANFTRQTSLEFSRETRPFDTWLVSEAVGPNDTNADKSVTPQK